MDDAVKMNEHEAIEMLLPWYVTDQLDAAEVAQVDAHLTQCAECRDLLEHETLLKAEIASMPIAVPQFLAPPTMPSYRASAASRGWQFTRQTVSQWTAKPLRVAAFAAAQAAMLVIVFQISQPTSNTADEYRTLSSGSKEIKANAIIMFHADTRESDFRALLIGANATIVGGPTESNVYYLRIDPATRDSALKSFRAKSQVQFAQPIDGE